MMYKNVKCGYVACLLLVFALLCLNALPGEAAPPSPESAPDLSEEGPEVYTVTGPVEDLEEAELDGRIFQLLSLQTSAGTGKGYLSEACRFIDDRGGEISFEVFFKRYMKRVITIDFIETRDGQYVVIECRVGNK
jgi:hypothetical protein